MTQLSSILSVIALTLASPSFAFAGMTNDLPDLTGLRGGRTANNGSEITDMTVGLAFRVNGQTALCTGSIIANDLILTAAHCLTGSNPVIFFGNNIPKTTTRIQSVATIIPSGYNPDASARDRYDIGLVRFEGGLPKGFKTADILTDGGEIHEHARMTIAGMGTNKAQHFTKFGQLRTTHFRVADIHYSLNNAQMEIRLRQNLFSAVCPGDSGGPAYVKKNGDLYLWGVANVIQGIGNPVRACGDYSVYANITSSSLSDWLNEAKAKLRAIDCSSEDCSESFQL